MKTPTLNLVGLRPGKAGKHGLSANQIKMLLVGIGLLISATVLLYTQYLVRQLREQEERIVKFYASTIQHYAEMGLNQESSTEVGEQKYHDYTYYLEAITPTINFPIVIATPNDEPAKPYLSQSLNVLDSTLAVTMSEQQVYHVLKATIDEMRGVYPPLEIKLGNMVIQKVYYANSALVRNLMLFPYIEILVVSGFIFLGYIAFNYVRTAEQSNVWVGLAKEAAHQLGTPLSSLLAWLEIIKLDAENPAHVREIVGQMEQDVERLSKISHRFSKIGSLPEMREENISAIIATVIAYFEKRLPNFGKRVKIKKNIQGNIMLRVNAELFEWVIENLVKNAVEAMESSGGIIDILLEQRAAKTVILVCDNGKGMTPKVKREVFKPGFSTKKRGWGLGLSLCKRIIEDYHGGKIYVKDTAPGKGTVFAIELPNPRKERSTHASAEQVQQEQTLYS
ncbi:MAG: HAMP domain-containing sensor histidine kinase [Bacteroidota bacterium]|nr:HAMP domain-containing histidine kinase [Candidatus Kapabacteria bacterium]MDW8219877.1 HAMP domain-containing sensor histidine kinase [Bacteroidota bacterium]